MVSAHCLRDALSHHLRCVNFSFRLQELVLEGESLLLLGQISVLWVRAMKSRDSAHLPSMLAPLLLTSKLRRSREE